ncbi:hypothetical protein BS50DRAFT_412665 [Corynespora cassiicola Philippines]|uniref:Uncharacterized protein n=1 Tax=Corynespora cassiicola Philippines TaxID=1448308 RepID=A0A2T2NLM4_CORCC|nr:hypothetical protein BS50DRAFT_412665 [Corynespora cassiicola Philippines]
MCNFVSSMILVYAILLGIRWCLFDFRGPGTPYGNTPASSERLNPLPDLKYTGTERYQFRNGYALDRHKLTGLKRAEALVLLVFRFFDGTLGLVTPDITDTQDPPVALTSELVSPRARLIFP